MQEDAVKAAIVRLQFHSGTCSSHQLRTAGTDVAPNLFHRCNISVRRCERLVEQGVFRLIRSFIWNNDNSGGQIAVVRVWSCTSGLWSLRSWLLFVCTDQSVFLPFSFTVRSNIKKFNEENVSSSRHTVGDLVSVSWLCKEYYDRMPLFYEPRFSSSFKLVLFFVFAMRHHFIWQDIFTWSIQ